MICGNCTLEMFLRPVKGGDPPLECPICRSNYNLSEDKLVDGLEKICQRGEKNTPDAKVCLAAEYFHSGEYQKSRELLESLDSDIFNYKGGCYYLALIYRYGLGGKRESKKAFQMFLKIGNVGRSLFHLGEMLRLGEGTAENKEYGSILVKISGRSPLPIHYRSGRNVLI